MPLDLARSPFADKKACQRAGVFAPECSLLQLDGAQVIPLAELDPGLSQQGIGHGEVEVEVGDAVLVYAGVAVHSLATGPVGV